MIHYSEILEIGRTSGPRQKMLNLMLCKANGKCAAILKEKLNVEKNGESGAETLRLYGEPE